MRRAVRASRTFYSGTYYGNQSGQTTIMRDGQHALDSMPRSASWTLLGDAYVCAYHILADFLGEQFTVRWPLGFCNYEPLTIFFAEHLLDRATIDAFRINGTGILEILDRFEPDKERRWWYGEEGSGSRGTGLS